MKNVKLEKRKLKKARAYQSGQNVNPRDKHLSSPDFGRGHDTGAETLWALERMLTRAQGFTLAFARVNVPTQRAELVKEIRHRVERQGIEIIEIDFQAPVSDFLNELLRRLAKVYLTKLKSEPRQLAVAESAPRFAVFVYGLEHSIPSSETYHPALSVINYKRENFRQHLAAPLVIWLPEYALQAIIEGAPDFWAWRSGVFEFVAPSSEVEKTWLTIEPERGQVELNRMTLAEKRNRIQLFSGLLAEYDARADAEFPEIAAIRMDLQDRIGRLYLLLGDYDCALEFYKREQTLAQKQNDKDGVARSSHRIGQISQARGNYEAALTEYEKALKTFEEIGNRAGVAGSLYEIGIVHEARGDYDLALSNYQKALTFAEEHGHRLGVASALNAIGNIHFRRGDYDAALAFHEKVLMITAELGDRVGTAIALNQIGIIHQVHGDYSAALAQYEKALMITEEIGYRIGVAGILHQIATIHQTHGDYNTALAKYEKSLKIKDELGDRAGMAVSLRNLGAIHQIREDYGAALTVYEKALKIEKNLGNRAGIADSNLHLGQLSTQTRSYPEAFENLFVAFNTFLQLQSPNASMAATNLKVLRAKWGAENFDAAWREKTGEAVPEWLARENVKGEQTQADN